MDLTGAHQYGYYLPYQVWEMYTDMPPNRGANDEREVKVLWQDGRVTDSCIHWYSGGKSRREYRLTRFGKDFPFRTFDNLGDMLVLVPENHKFFRCYVLDQDEDMDEIQLSLGVEAVDGWAAYQAGRPPVSETAEECVERNFRAFLAPLEVFPDTASFAKQARDALEECIKNFGVLPANDRLVRLVKGEYRLFQMVERQVCQKHIQKLFKNVDDFLDTAKSFLNRRMSRAGRSLENHVAYVLNSAGVKFDARPKIDGKVEPDILIPGKAEYNDPEFPADRLCIVGVKTTCKDRWRQVLNEGKRIRQKHILTMQRGISANQLKEMMLANVTLVVPESLHADYPKESGANIVTVEQFIGTIKSAKSTV